MGEAMLGTAYINIVARASQFTAQARTQVQGALASAETSALAGGGGSRIAKSAEMQLESGFAAGAKRGVRDLERETAGVFRRVRGQAAGFTQAALGIGGKPLAIAALAVSVGLLGKSAVDFQEQTAKIANSAQISDKAAGEIGQAFLKTAGHTTFSAKQMVTAYAPIAGVFRTIYGHALSTAEAVKFMASAQELAEASGQPLAKSTKDLSQILITYHLGLGDASHASDILYNTSRNLGVGIQDIQSQFQRLAPRLAGTGTTLGQTAGLFQEVAKQVGTGRFALRTAGVAVQALVAPSAGAKGALAALGVELVDSRGKFVGINTAISRLHDAVAKLPGGVAGLAAAQKLQKLATVDTQIATKKLSIETELHTLALSKQTIQNQIAVIGFGKHSKAATAQTVELRRSALAITEHEQALRSQVYTLGLTHKALGAQEGPLKAQAGALNKNGLLTAVFGRQAGIMAGIIAGGVPALHKATAATNADGTAKKAAEKLTGTLAGRIRTLRSEASDLGVMFGQKLVPVLSLVVAGMAAILGAILPTINFIKDNATVFEIIGAAVGGFAVVIGGAAAATALYTAATSLAASVTAGFRGAMLLLNLVIAANPIVFIVAALVALGAAFFVAYEKVKPFHDAVDAVGRALKTAFVDALHAVQTAFHTVISFVTDHWKIILPIVLTLLGPITVIGGAIYELATHWSEVWHGMLQVAGYIVGTIIQDVIKPIVDAFIWYAKTIIDTSDKAFGWVPGLGGKLHSARKAVDGFASDTNKTLQNWADSAFKWGDQAGGGLADGLANGVSRRQAAAVQATKHLTGLAVKQLHLGLETGSPSRVSARAGGWFVDGFVNAVDGNLHRVIGAVGRMTDASSSQLGSTARPIRLNHSAVGGTRGGDGSELLHELRLLRLELTGQRTYQNEMVRETRALPQAIGNVLIKAGDTRYLPREMRAS